MIPRTSGGATIAVYRLGPVPLHSYVAPEASAVAATPILETANALHLVDAPCLQGFAAEARAYADSLGKRIERCCLSHAHPALFSGRHRSPTVRFCPPRACPALSG